MIKIPQTIKADNDFGPINIAVFIILLYIKVDAIPRMPSKIKIMLSLIFFLLSNKKGNYLTYRPFIL